MASSLCATMASSSSLRRGFGGGPERLGAVRLVLVRIYIFFLKCFFGWLGREGAVLLVILLVRVFRFFRLESRRTTD